MKRIPVYAWLGIVPLFWAGNFHLARYSVQHLPPNLVGSIRFIIATLLLVPLFLVSERPKWHNIKTYLPAMVAVGVCGVFGYNYFFFKAMQTTTATNASLLLAFNPLATLLLSIFWLRTRVSTMQWLGVALGMAGVMLIITQGKQEALLSLQISYGDALLLVVALSFACANVMVRKYLYQASSMATSAISTTVGTLLLLGFTFFEPQSNVPVTTIPATVWAAILTMTMSGSIVGYIIWNHSVAKVGADKAALFTNLTPFYTCIISICLGYDITQVQWLGGICIVVGIVMASVRYKAKPQQVSKG